jgi:hypothetical protein
MILPKTFLKPIEFVFLYKTHIICPDFKFCDYANKDKKYIFTNDYFYNDYTNITKSEHPWPSILYQMKMNEQKLFKSFTN